MDRARLVRLACQEGLTMCGGGGYDAGDAANDRAKSRAEAESQRLAAEQQAQAAANASTAALRTRRRTGSLLARGAQRAPQRTVTTSSTLAMGAQTLGGT